MSNIDEKDIIEFEESNLEKLLSQNTILLSHLNNNNLNMKYQIGEKEYKTKKDLLETNIFVEVNTLNQKTVSTA